MTPEERAEQAFETALIVANMCPLPQQEWFRDVKRHIVRQEAAAIREAVAEEREACARELDEEGDRLDKLRGDGGMHIGQGVACSVAAEKCHERAAALRDLGRSGGPHA